MSSPSSSSGIGFFGVLTIAFIVLKLTGVIAWSWWLVLAPAWIAVIFWLIAVSISIWITVEARKVTKYFNDFKRDL